MFDYEIRQSAENKRYEKRRLSEHLSMSRADSPDEWLMDEFISMAKKLEAMCEANSNAVLGEVVELLDVIYQIRATDMRATEFTYDSVWSMINRILEKADKVRANFA